MREKIEDWLLMVRLNCSHWRRLAREVRGVIQDRRGKCYWRLEHEWSPNHIRISVIAWPGLKYASRNLGWLAIGEQRQEKTTWMIYDIQVYRNNQQGIGTALVHAAIALASKRGAHQLRGMITKEDAKKSPFLATWYAKLGFTVQLHEGDADGNFWMDLTPSRPHPPLPLLMETTEQK